MLENVQDVLKLNRAKKESVAKSYSEFLRNFFGFT